MEIEQHGPEQSVVKEEINRKIKQYLDSSEDEKTPTYRTQQMQLKDRSLRWEVPTLRGEKYQTT